MFITFFFNLPKDLHKKYYGKYNTDNIYDDHEGLDEEIKPYLLQGLIEYHEQFEKKQKLSPEQIKDLKNRIQIGIMSVSEHNNISVHSSIKERFVFDFYCHKYTINHEISLTMYMFGKLIEGPAK